MQLSTGQVGLISGEDAEKVSNTSHRQQQKQQQQQQQQKRETPRSRQARHCATATALATWALFAALSMWLPIESLQFQPHRQPHRQQQQYHSQNDGELESPAIRHQIDELPLGPRLSHRVHLLRAPALAISHERRHDDRVARELGRPLEQVTLLSPQHHEDHSSLTTSLGLQHQQHRQLPVEMSEPELTSLVGETKTAASGHEPVFVHATPRHRQQQQHSEQRQAQRANWPMSSRELSRASQQRQQQLLAEQSESDAIREAVEMFNLRQNGQLQYQQQQHANRLHGSASDSLGEGAMSQQMQTELALATLSQLAAGKLAPIGQQQQQQVQPEPEPEQAQRNQEPQQQQQRQQQQQIQQFQQFHLQQQRDLAALHEALRVGKSMSMEQLQMEASNSDAARQASGAEPAKSDEPQKVDGQAQAGSATAGGESGGQVQLAAPSSQTLSQLGQLDQTVEPRQRRRLFNRILKKTEWNHLFLELTKVLLRYFLDLAMKDIVGKQSNSAGGGSTADATTSRKKLDAQLELTDIVKDFVKTAISNL